jgi:uncharacterized membrane protein
MLSSFLLVLCTGEIKLLSYVLSFLLLAFVWYPLGPHTKFIMSFSLVVIRDLYNVVSLVNKKPRHLLG